MRIGIIGGGPAGYSSALLAGILGNQVVLFEKDTVGGVCLNRGCIPVKALIKVAHGLNTVKKIETSGIKAEVTGIDWEKVKKTSQLASRRLVAGVQNLLKKRKVEVINAHAELKDSGVVVTNGKEYTFDKILVSTGSRPRIPPFRVAKNVWTSDDALNAKEIPESIGIIGGGVIGIEFAYMFRSFGSQVTIYEIMDEILPGEDKGMASSLRKEMEKMGVKFKLGVMVNEITERKGRFTIKYTDGGKESADKLGRVLVAIGREVVADGLPDLIEMENGFIKVNRMMETTMKNVYAAGDCVGGYLLAHTAYHEGEIAVFNMNGRNEKLNENYVPRVIYTKPEFAACGEVEENLKEKGVDYQKEFFPFTCNGRAIAESETRGGIKMLFDPDGRILGGAILGGYASEMIHIICVSMKNGVTARELFHTIFAHPTYSETIKEAAAQFLHLPLHGDGG